MSPLNSSPLLHKGDGAKHRAGGASSGGRGLDAVPAFPGDPRLTRRPPWRLLFCRDLPQSAAAEAEEQPKQHGVACQREPGERGRGADGEAPVLCPPLSWPGTPGSPWGPRGPGTCQCHRAGSAPAQTRLAAGTGWCHQTCGATLILVPRGTSSPGSGQILPSTVRSTRARSPALSALFVPGPELCLHRHARTSQPLRTCRGPGHPRGAAGEGARRFWPGSWPWWELLCLQLTLGLLPWATLCQALRMWLSPQVSVPTRDCFGLIPSPKGLSPWHAFVPIPDMGQT